MFKTELGKKGAKCRELLFKEWTDRFNGNIFVANASAAGYQDDLSTITAYGFMNRFGYCSGFVRNNLMEYNCDLPF